MIYSPREKLQLLRKQYKISQIALVGNSISRSHLAMIETGKTKLSKKVAQSLVENFNNILKAKEIDEKITLDYLIEDTNIQIMKKRAHYVESLNKGILNEELIQEIENFIKVSDVESKVVLYAKIGDFYYAAGHLKRAFDYFSRTFDEALIVNNSKFLENIISKLTSINYLNGDYINNSFIEKAIKDKLSKMSLIKKQEIVNNFILSFSTLGDYDKAIYYIDFISKDVKDSEALYELETKKAKFMEEKGLFASAISIYRGMLIRYKDEKKKFIISINLMIAYKLKGESSKVEAYYKKNIATLKKYPITLETQWINYQMGEIALYLYKTSKALYYFKSVIENINPNNSNSKLLMGTIHNILKLVKRDDYEFVKKIEELYFDQDLDNNMLKIGYLFLNYYRNFNFYLDESRFLSRVCSVI